MINWSERYGVEALRPPVSGRMVLLLHIYIYIYMVVVAAWHPSGEIFTIRVGCFNWRSRRIYTKNGVYI